MNTDEAKKLLDKYIAGQCSPEELLLLQEAMLHMPRQHSEADSEETSQQVLQDMALYLEQQGLPNLQPAARVRTYNWYYAAAAILLVALATALYFNSALFVNRKSETLSASGVIVNQNDIPPGYNQATLTLADGTKVELDSAQRGIIVKTEAITYGNGSKVEGIRPKVEGEEVRQLVLSTPRGGQYQVILEDGTKVWLNAASTLKYPSRFSGDTREVFLEGEAFFDVNNRVAGDRVSRVPFIVKSKNQEIDVLGTSFNVSTYTEESTVRTTVVSGAVQVASKIASEKGSYTLKPTPYLLKLAPGEQSIMQGDGQMTTVRVDVNSEIAWKQGLFLFKKETLASVMKQIARWYDIQVVYDQEVDQNELYGGSFSRSSTLNSVLRKLALTGGITYHIEAERRVRISRKKDQ